jgi:cellulose synthase (UDP-forming)
MSLGTELPPVEEDHAEFDLTIDDRSIIPRASETAQIRRPSRARAWMRSNPADRVPRVALLAALGAGTWLFLARPEQWYRFILTGVAAVALSRVGLLRRRGPVAALVGLLRGVGRGLEAKVRPVRVVRRFWMQRPAKLRATLLALIAANTLVASALLGSNLVLFVAMATLNFISLSLISAGPEPEPEPEPVVDLRDADPTEVPDERGTRTVRTRYAPLSFPTLRPFPSLSRPGWDTWESWDSLKPPEPPEPPKPPALESVPEVVVEGPAESDPAGPAEDPSKPDEPLEIDPLPVLSGLLRRFRTQITVAVLVVTGGLIAYAHPGPLLVPAVLVVGTLAVLSSSPGRDETIRMVLALGVVVAGIDYVSWRFVVTNWFGWWIALPLLAAETLGAIHVLGYQITLWPSPQPKLDEVEDPTSNPIFILVPTVNEGVEVLRPTIEACLEARDRYLEAHPNGRVSIVVCNDGRVARYPRWREVPALARSLGVASVSRRHKGGAKAGNIEHARHCFRIHGNALLVIFDADQVPSPDFLLKAVPSFADPKVGWVQTGQYYANLGNPVSKWADDQQSMFYNLLCPGKAAHNAAFICGTNVVIRAAALDQIGGLPQDSVTEDFAASISLHSDWKSVYLSDVLATGLGPLDLPSYLKQQRRWAIGTLGVFRTHWRDIFLPRRGGLAPVQRVQYLLACTHYLSGIRDLVYLVCPMLFILTGIPAVRSASLGQYLSHFLPYGLLSASALWYSARGVTGIRGIIMGFGSFPTLVGSLVAVAAGRKTAFTVTSKRRHAQQSLRYLNVYLFSAAACIASIVWATQVGKRQQTSMFISVGWVVYSLLMLFAFLWLAIRDLRAHSVRGRAGRPDTTTLKNDYPSKLENRPTGLRPVWNLAAAAVIAIPLMLGTQLKSLGIFSRPVPPPFGIAIAPATTALVGVSIPAELLPSQTSLVRTDVASTPGVVGRTEDLSAHFPLQWAADLSHEGARPWITLQFGEFGPGGSSPLGASLPAIINGVDDTSLGRWATEIRNFAKPVYVTVLLQADRNWAISSGVANGGIPEDVSKAWLHIQSVFRAHGARNVAWVWAPADPLHDQQYAPPLDDIGAVLQSFVNYPGTVWGDPGAVLSKLQQRYPGKPIFIDVSVDGPPAEKSAWLNTFGRAVQGDVHIHAVLYHEGGPELNPTQAVLKAWSADSDGASLHAWLHTLALLRSPAPHPHSSTLTRSQNG